MRLILFVGFGPLAMAAEENRHGWSSAVLPLSCTRSATLANSVS